MLSPSSLYLLNAPFPIYENVPPIIEKIVDQGTIINCFRNCYMVTVIDIY